MNMQAQLQAALDAATSAPILDDTSPVAVPLTDPPNTDDAASSWKHVSEVVPDAVAADGADQISGRESHARDAQDVTLRHDQARP